MYRSCVGAMILNKKGHVFVGQRLDMISPAWQMPQGGVEDGEDLQTAIFREIEEEVGVHSNHLQLISQCEGWFFYDLPSDLQKKLWGGAYCGQKQKWFLMKFLGQDRDININTEEPEFRSWQWMPAHKVVAHAVDFKKDVYERVYSLFSPLIDKSI